MTDARNLGPFGGGGESQPATVDLTRIDIRRGTLYLPRRFYGALPEGEVRASDTASGKAIAVHFRPPRRLEGLGPFFEEHELRPNDAVTLAMTDELRLTPVRRERRQQPQAAGGGKQQAGPMKGGRGDAPAHQATPAVESSSGDPPAESPRYTPSPPESRSGWQDVLHDPKPRQSRSQEGGRVEEAGKQRQRAELPREQAESESVGPEQQAPRDLSGFGTGEWRRGKPARLIDAEESSPGQRPLTPSVERAQGGLFEEQPAAEPGPAAERSAPSRRASPSQSSAPSQGPVPNQAPAPTRQPPPTQRPAPDQQAAPAQQSEEREPVPVGAAAQNDVKGQISSYLHDPSTPAIVRAAAVAQSLGLPLEAVQRGMAEVSRDSEGAVAPIRPDVYLVKRGR